jgi:hypothetical protein
VDLNRLLSLLKQCIKPHFNVGELSLLHQCHAHPHRLFFRYVCPKDSISEKGSTSQKTERLRFRLKKTNDMLLGLWLK